MIKSLTQNLLIDKTNWTPVKLGDVVKEPKESVKDFTKETIEHVVGLEHIDKENIHLKRSASINESTTFTKKFSSGDVLFGRRRAYLKKAAQAKFSGICSGDITVMRAKEGLLPELLPFIVNNEKFFDYAITHSAGGLSPRVKFKDLANYEFLLPDKEEQAQLANLLWGMDDVIKKYSDLNEKLQIFSDSYSLSKFSGFESKASTGQILSLKLQNIMEISPSNGVFKTSNYFGSGTLLVNVTDIYSSFKVDPTRLERVKLNQKEKMSFSALPGDVIFNRSSLVREGIGHACLVPEYEEEMVFECHLIRVRVQKEQIDSRYLCRYCLSPLGRKYLMSRSQTTTMTTINQEALNKMPIPLPPLVEQEELASHFDNIDTTSTLLNSKISASKTLLNSLINQVF